MNETTSVVEVRAGLARANDGRNAMNDASLYAGGVRLALIADGAPNATPEETLLTMQPAIARIHQGLSALILAGLILDVYLVGAGLFGATTFEPHRLLGLILAISIMLLLLLALLSRPSRRMLGLSALLATLTVLQVALPSLRTGVPLVAALHAINALALLTVTAAIVRTPGAAHRSLLASTR